MSAFLRNQWYTAATSAEIGDKPLARFPARPATSMFAKDQQQQPQGLPNTDQAKAA